MDTAHVQINDSLEPAAAITERDHERPLEVLATTVRIHDLTIARPAIAAYLDHIAPDKQEIALVHALEVGITELAARRERFKK